MPCIDVITVPAETPENSIRSTDELPKNHMNELISCDYYKVFLLDVTEKVELIQDYPFLIFSVLEGEGTLNGQPLKKGMHFILPYEYGKIEIKGNLKMIASTINAK